MSDSDVKRIEEKLQEILDIMHGIDGHDGQIAKVNSHERWIKAKDRDFYGTFNFVYRTIIGIILLFIAYKVGITPP